MTPLTNTEISTYFVLSKIKFSYLYNQLFNNQKFTTKKSTFYSQVHCYFNISMQSYSDYSVGNFAV